MERAEESQTSSPLQPPPPPLRPPPHSTEEEMWEAEKPQETPPLLSPPPPHATEAGMEEVQGKRGEHRRKEGLDEHRLPPLSLPLKPAIPFPVDDRGFHGDHVAETFDCEVGGYTLLSERY